MAGLELFGVGFVVVAIVYAFYKKNDKLALALIIVLLALLFLLGQLGKLNFF